MPLLLFLRPLEPSLLPLNPPRFPSRPPEPPLLPLEPSRFPLCPLELPLLPLEPPRFPPRPLELPLLPLEPQRPPRPRRPPLFHSKSDSSLQVHDTVLLSSSRSQETTSYEPSSQGPGGDVHSEPSLQVQFSTLAWYDHWHIAGNWTLLATSSLHTHESIFRIPLHGLSPSTCQK